MALVVGVFAALIVAIGLFVRHGSRARRLRIPFAPSLALGGVVAVFAGGSLLDAYPTL